MYSLIYQENGYVKCRRVVNFDAIDFVKKINCDISNFLNVLSNF